MFKPNFTFDVLISMPIIWTLGRNSDMTCKIAPL